MTAEQKAQWENEAEQLLGHLSSASISAIASVIKRDWKAHGTIYFGAVPYLDAMLTMDKITDAYGADPGTHIVNYFLGNATTWRGPAARVIKAELNRRVKGAK